MLADNAAALGPVVDDLVAALQAFRADLDDRATLGDHLARVTAAAGGLRAGETDWRPCPDLDAALASADPVLVRAGADGLETGTLPGG